MTDDTREPGKSPRPSDATLALEQHVIDLRFDLGLTLSGQADRDVAALLAVQQRALGRLATIALQHARDPELRALAQRIADQTGSLEGSLKDIQARLAR
ncbi:hypothetical protein [Ideonella alba]|uniref:Uncharacterized protein n=1 Tax=Ideonella alba TaxID=2824118 RepID=A0A940YB17_9BURK|nr:hypothetical protein [Ideonella alba]MBQ0931881.1 hypothetical protein [Ideonella alba]